MKYLIKLLQHYGRDWTRTNGVSNVTVLQTATLAARLLSRQFGWNSCSR